MTGSELDELREAIREARAHVYRQRYYGKHEQDRIDAEEWWAKYSGILEKKTPSYQETGRGGECEAVGWHNISSTVAPDLISGGDEKTSPTESNSNPTTNKPEDAFDVERENQLSLQLSRTITNEDA